MSRLVLVDTADELPGLLPLHAWSAIMTSDLVLVGSPEHPFVGHLDVADLRYEVVAEPSEAKALSRADLLSGLSPLDKARAESIVDRVTSATGDVAYLFGSTDQEAFTRTLGLEAARAGVEVEVVYFGVLPRGSRVLELVRVMERLRAPDGCPWDREQDHRSLARYAVEEVYELLEAIDAGEPDALREELGDVLLQVVFHAQVAADGGEYTIDDVAGGIVEKLVRRHPHVFGDTTVADADEVVANWETLKAAEKPERTGVFDGVATGQPSIAYSEQLQRRAAKVGFDWAADEDAVARVRAELDELVAATDTAQREHEVGDLLLSVVGLARRHGIDAEMALRGAAARFRRRFEDMVPDPHEDLRALPREEWQRRWDEAKVREQRR